MSTLRLARWSTVALLGVGVEWLGHNSNTGLAVADLAVGLAFLSGGLLLGERGRHEAVALLFFATGLTWFFGTLAGSDVNVLSTVGSAMLYAHRGPFTHLILAYPTGHLRSWLDRMVVAAAYVDGLVVSFAQSKTLTVALVVAVVAAGALALRNQQAELTRPRALALLCFALVGASLVLVSVSGFVGTALLSDTALLSAYNATLVVTAIGLTVWLLAARRRPAGVADLVVELGTSSRSGTLREALARAVGDSSLEIGYRVAGSYVDEDGNAMQLPSRSDERTVTFLEREGEPVAVLVHDPALTSDPVLAEAVGAAARLTGSNAQLQADLRAQVRELATSRRRVVEVGDVQRSRLERRLDQAAALHLVEMRAAVAQALQVASPAVADALVLVEQELDQTVIELRQLAHGIHPHALTESGLAPALAELAASAPITVSVAATGERFTPAVEVAAYFVCAEALANVAKYAQTDAALVGIRQHNGRLVVSVADDGVGGADSTRGSGLRGLADRVEALGGLLTVSSPTSGGTAVLAEIPLDGAS